MRLVLVEWIDAQADAVMWSGVDELETEPRLIRSVGYELPVTVPGHTSVAGSWDEAAEAYGGVMHIPDGMVCSVSVLDPRPEGGGCVNPFSYLGLSTPWRRR